MHEVLDYKKDLKNYVYAKILEGLIEAKLSIEMLKKGLLTDAASKAFLAVKAVVSGLVVKNLDKIIQDKAEKEVEWYKRIGYSAPTRGIIGISYDLEKIGYNVSFPVRVILELHSFSYNGFDQNLVSYRNEEEVRKDIMTVIDFLSKNIREFFSELMDEKLENSLKELNEMIKTIS